MKLNKPITVQEASDILDISFVGDGQRLIHGINEIHKVEAGDLTFVDIEKYYTKSLTSAATIILINKEVAVSVLNGVIWSIVIGLITYYWFSDLFLSIIIAVAIIVNLVVAAFSGAFLPLLLTKLKIDPALAGGVILTTITDVIGFVAFLGLAAIFI